MSQLSYKLAFDAIEEYVADRHEEAKGHWREIVPADDWGYDERGWEAGATRIVDNFNERLPVGQQVDVPPSAKRNSRNQALIEFQAYLAAKADELGFADLIHSMERGA